MIHCSSMYNLERIQQITYLFLFTARCPREFYRASNYAMTVTVYKKLMEFIRSIAAFSLQKPIFRQV